MLSPNLATHLSIDLGTKFIKHTNRIIPRFIQGELIMAIINRLAIDFYEDSDLDFMDNKVARVSFSDIDLNWYFMKKPGMRIEFLSAFNGIEPDVVFTGDVGSFVLMASQSVDPDTLFFNRKLSIEGDTELGLEIKNLIDQFDIERLPRPMQFVLKHWSRLLLEQKQLQGQANA